MLPSTPRTFIGSTTFTVTGMTCAHCQRAVTDGDHRRRRCRVRHCRPRHRHGHRHGLPTGRPRRDRRRRRRGRLRPRPVNTARPDPLGDLTWPTPLPPGVRTPGPLTPLRYRRPPHSRPHIHLSARKFALHFAEMVVAMAVGMVVLHPVWMFVLDTVGAAGLMHNPYSGALIMATNMTVAMSAWMKFRGHRWRPIVEMGAAMYVPFLVLFVPLGLELIDKDA